MPKTPAATHPPEELGLRERKKLQTGRKLWTVAIGLFVERGFDQVSVAEIAAAAEVSKMTVFNYFPTKEDLVLLPMEKHTGEVAETVRDRPAGCSAVAAVRDQYLAALDAQDPASGLCDQQAVLDVLRLIRDTPALALRARAASVRAEELLAAELRTASGDGDDLTARLAAAQLLATRRTLVMANQRRMIAGEPAGSVLPEARANALRAFALVEHGLGDYCGG
ncbi:TetR family transcriptional regulator [Kitasatospora herbaricolor]|uniref:TetR family transcriptional regulator n=1 Tax=Kitasatospora herbaricolor TaxID=68217 RepID=UPI00174C3C5C|nr:TetR family transcriptional regulator [Kitasatospora herbaricolor]MDQ0310967.1 AcrR family transcriptional regulator [Kitasatospora herbaricolor]GGV31874.1 TetR family transcriptional regulator [Kitasatospora herbaricolor]